MHFHERNDAKIRKAFRTLVRDGGFLHHRGMLVLLQHSKMKHSIYQVGSLGCIQRRFHSVGSFQIHYRYFAAYPRHFAVAGLVLLNTDHSASQSCAGKNLKVVWGKHTGMELESCLQQLNKNLCLQSGPQTRKGGFAIIVRHLLL